MSGKNEKCALQKKEQMKINEKGTKRIKKKLSIVFRNNRKQKTNGKYCIYFSIFCLSSNFNKLSCWILFIWNCSTTKILGGRRYVLTKFYIFLCVYIVKMGGKMKAAPTATTIKSKDKQQKKKNYISHFWFQFRIWSIRKRKRKQSKTIVKVTEIYLVFHLKFFFCPLCSNFEYYERSFLTLYSMQQYKKQ